MPGALQIRAGSAYVRTRERCGFRPPACRENLCSVFRKQYGITPKEYQNQMKKQRGSISTATQITDSYDMQTN